MINLITLAKNFSVQYPIGQCNIQGEMKSPGWTVEKEFYFNFPASVRFPSNKGVSPPLVCFPTKCS